MQSEVPSEDLIFGSVVLASFLACVFAAGLLLRRVALNHDREGVDWRDQH